MPEDKQDDEKKDGDQVLQDVTERLKFFFSNANVRQDYFMRKFLVKTEKEEGDDSSPGTIPIEALLRFNTIKKYTTDPAMIVRAVKEKLSDRLVLKDEEKSVGRVKPFTMDLMEENIPLSLYIKNLPTKEEEQDDGRKVVNYATDIGEISKLFEEYGDLAIVKLRFKKSEKSDDEQHTDDIHYGDDTPGKKKPRRRYPLGACIVEFDNKEDFEKAAAEVLTVKDGKAVEPKRKIEIGGKSVEIMSLKDYIDGSRKEAVTRKREREDGDEEKDEIEDFSIDWKPGCVIRLKGLPEDCDREAIMDAVTTCLNLSVSEARKDKNIFVDYSRGQKDGAIRFSAPEDMGDLVKKLSDGEIKIAGAKVEDVSVLEGDDEKKYWYDFIEFKKKLMRHKKEERGSSKHRNKRRKGRQNSRRNN